VRAFSAKFSINVAGDLVALLEQEIVSVFVGRFRWRLLRFFGDEKPFAVNGTAVMSDKFFKI